MNSELFPAGEAAEYFHTDAELVEKCHYFLANEERRIAVASRGHQLCLSSGYSYHARAQQFMKDVMPFITKSGLILNHHTPVPAFNPVSQGLPMEAMGQGSILRNLR